MVYSYDQLVKHNKKFKDAFIDLKVVGWNSYSKALDDYTFGFFKQQLKDTNTAVSNLGTFLKA